MKHIIIAVSAILILCGCNQSSQGQSQPQNDDKANAFPKDPINLWKSYNSHLYVKECNNCKYKIVEVSYDFFEENNLSSNGYVYEDSDVKIISKFKGLTFYIEKPVNKYWLLWVPETKYDWIEKIEATENEEVVTLQERIFKTIKIDMMTGHVDIHEIK